MAKYGLKSSPEAWNFVRSVTGYGASKTSSQQEGEVTRDSTCAVVENRDPLNYARFDALVANWESENDGQVGSTSFTQPSSASKPVNRLSSTALEPSELATSELMNTSDYFTSNSNYMNQGCAHDRSKERALYERPTEEKLRMAERFRLDGNQFYEKGDFKVAGVHYKKALIYFEYTFPENPDQEASLEQLKIRTHLNLAAVLYNMKEYGNCIEQCRQALKLNSECAKAHFRTGLANMALDNFDEAEKSLHKASELVQGGDIASIDAIERNLSILVHKRIEYETKKPELNRKMASGLFTRGPSKKSSRSVSFGESTSVSGVVEEEEQEKGQAADRFQGEEENDSGELDETTGVDQSGMTSDVLDNPSIAVVGQETPSSSKIEHHCLTDDRSDDQLAVSLSDDSTDFRVKKELRDVGHDRKKKDPAMFLLNECPSFTAFADQEDRRNSQVESPRPASPKKNGTPAETKLFFYGGILGMTTLSICITAGTMAIDWRNSPSQESFKSTPFSAETFLRLISLAFPCSCLALVLLSHFFDARVLVR